MQGWEQGTIPARKPHLLPAAGTCLGAPELFDTPVTRLTEPSPPEDPFSFENQTGSILKIPRFSACSSQDKVPTLPHATRLCQERTAAGVSQRGSKQQGTGRAATPRLGLGNHTLLRAVLVALHL